MRQDSLMMVQDMYYTETWKNYHLIIPLSQALDLALKSLRDVSSDLSLAEFGLKGNK